MLKYVGDGSFIVGVPARDLTDAEEKQFAPVIAEQEKATGTKLYKKAAQRKAASKDSDA